MPAQLLGADGVTPAPATLRQFLHGLPGVDQVGAEARAGVLSTRSIKTSAKAYAIDQAIAMIDLTTLEGQDTPGKVRALCAKAMRPDPADQTCPAVAAICVYPDLVATARAALAGHVKVASVATAFPSGRRPPRYQAAGHRGRRCGRCRRDRHGDRPGCLPDR